VGNEENGYPDPDLSKTMISVTKELSDTHKKAIKEEIWEELPETFLEKILDMVNQNVQDAFKKFQDTKNKEREMTQKPKNSNSEKISANTKVKQRTL
jgi:hypothetical protein